MEDEFLEDLLIAGQDVVARNPMIGFDEWVDLLMKEYPTEVIDAAGPDQNEAYKFLKEIWSTHFKALSSLKI